MADERDDDQFDTNESSGGQQQTTGQQGQQNEFGQQASRPAASARSNR